MNKACRQDIGECQSMHLDMFSPEHVKAKDTWTDLADNNWKVDYNKILVLSTSEI